MHQTIPPLFHVFGFASDVPLHDKKRLVSGGSLNGTQLLTRRRTTQDIGEQVQHAQEEGGEQ